MHATSLTSGVLLMWETLEAHGLNSRELLKTQAGDYNIKYGVIGLRYSSKEFQKMLYANARLDSSHLTDGSRIANVYTIGVCWDLP